MKEIALYVPKGAPNRKSLLAASEGLVRQIVIPSADSFTPQVELSCNKIDSEHLLEVTLREGTTSVALVVSSGNLDSLADTIARIHASRGEARPTAWFVVIDRGNFPSGKRPPHTRIFTPDKTEDARSALKLALQAADAEELERLEIERRSLQDQIARI